MIVVTGLIWDEWNKDHISKHLVTIEEVEEVCHGKYNVIESYKGRILLFGKTKAKRLLAVVLSPEDRNGKSYENGIYYVITSYEKN